MSLQSLVVIEALVMDEIAWRSTNINSGVGGSACKQHLQAAAGVNS